MTKSQKRERYAKQIAMYLQANMADTVARSLSAEIRASMTKMQRDELMAWARTMPAVVQHPEFIVA